MTKDITLNKRQLLTYAAAYSITAELWQVPAYAQNSDSLAAYQSSGIVSSDAQCLADHWGISRVEARTQIGNKILAGYRGNIDHEIEACRKRSDEEANVYHEITR